MTEDQLVLWRRLLGLKADDRTYDEIIQTEYRRAVATQTGMSYRRIYKTIKGEP